MILLIDFQEAFDSVSFRFLELTLEVFGFEPNYRKWISILLRGFNACTVVNDNISERFAIKRGCRQGEPLSGYRFILCIAILALALNKSKAKPYNKSKTMLSIFGSSLDKSDQAGSLSLKWCTKFTLLGLDFDQYLEEMDKTLSRLWKKCKK